MTDPYAGGNSVPPTPITEVQAVPHSNTLTGHSNLPFTGGDFFGVTVIGILVIFVGSLTRRRRISV
jgi:hypothetical protein